MSFHMPEKINFLLVLPNVIFITVRNEVACVKNSVRGVGVSASVHAGIQPPRQTPPPWADTHPPLGRHPPGQTTPPRRLLLRTVRILMECILVEKNSTCDENIDILRIQIIVVDYPEGSFFLSFSKMIK